MYLAGTVVATLSVTQEVAAWQGRASFTIMTNLFLIELNEFSENI